MEPNSNNIRVMGHKMEDLVKGDDVTFRCSICGEWMSARYAIHSTRSAIGFFMKCRACHRRIVNSVRINSKGFNSGVNSIEKVMGRKLKTRVCKSCGRMVRTRSNELSSCVGCCQSEATVEKKKRLGEVILNE